MSENTGGRERLRVLWFDKHGNHWGQTITMDEFEEWWLGVGMHATTVRIRTVLDGEEAGLGGQGAD